MVDPLLQRPLEVRNTFGTTSKSHLLAEIVTTLSADDTLGTRNPNLQGYSVTNGESRDLRTNADYDAGRFMTK